jgi:Tfp pilus assembly protein PilE
VAAVGSTAVHYLQLYSKLDTPKQVSSSANHTYHKAQFAARHTILYGITPFFQGFWYWEGSRNHAKLAWQSSSLKSLQLQPESSTASCTRDTVSQSCHLHATNNPTTRQSDTCQQCCNSELDQAHWPPLYTQRAQCACACRQQRLRVKCCNKTLSQDSPYWSDSALAVNLPAYTVQDSQHASGTAPHVDTVSTRAHATRDCPST